MMVVAASAAMPDVNGCSRTPPTTSGLAIRRSRYRMHAGLAVKNVLFRHVLAVQLPFESYRSNCGSPTDSIFPLTNRPIFPKLLRTI